MRRNSYNKNYNSTLTNVLNFMIIAACSAVIILLCIYLYSFLSKKFNDDYDVSKLHVIPEETEIVTVKIIPPEISLTTVSETIITTTVPSETEVTDEPVAVETEPLSTDYDKEFFQNIMFIGDSIGTGLSGFGYLPAENVFAQVGLNPDSVLTHAIADITDPLKTEKTAAEKAAELQPEYICIMLGTNGLAYMGNEYMVNKMTLLIDQLAEYAPQSEIVILSIPPVTAQHEAENLEKLVDIIDYNNRLQVMAENKNCHFVDLFSLLQDETGYFSSDYAEVDGLHFQGKTYSAMLHAIEEKLLGDSDNTVENTDF